ncbi:hypothetical protein [Actinomadura luteofluorescens]
MAVGGAGPARPAGIKQEAAAERHLREVAQRHAADAERERADTVAQLDAAH